MHCSFPSDPNRPRFQRGSALTFPARKGGFFGWAAVFFLAVSAAKVFAAPTPIETNFSDSEVLATLPESTLVAASMPSDPTGLADRVQSHIQQSRNTGDPRFLGYAEGLLKQWDKPMTDRLKVLQATVDQSNHRFEKAIASLDDVLSTGENRQQKLQARLMLANIYLVQGQYDAAAVQCGKLAQALPGLISASCQASVLARTGQPEAAYEQLKQVHARNPQASPVSQLWAEGTLGDIAAQLDNPAAEKHWQAVLAQQPDDLYTRAQLADWYLSNDQTKQTLRLTDGYELVDALAVIRVIALEQTNHPDASELRASLEERFEEARWRGNLLHKRELGRFQLDVAGNAEQALEYARANWKDQREPADTRLLLRAALASGDDQQLQSVNDWLQQKKQQDARYPETTP